MSKNINVLITGAGRRVPIIRAFRKALSGDGVKGRVICVDMDALSAGLYSGDNHYVVPGAGDPEYVPVLFRICRREEISFLVPTTDEELTVLSREQDRFRNHGIFVMVSSYATVLTCIDKFATYQFLRAHSIPTPQTFSAGSLPPDEKLDFPLMVKPRTGKGSINCFKVGNLSDLQYCLRVVPEAIIQEFAPGREYTADVMCNKSSQALIVVPRQRIATIAGVSQKGRTERNRDIEELAVEISAKLKIIGPANIQFMVDGAMPRCIEINPRLSGGIPLSLAAGADFAGMMVDLARGKDLSPALGRFEEGLIMLRYDESVFIKEGPNGYVPRNPV